MKKLMLLVVLITVGCGAGHKPNCLHYTERGWVRQVWGGRWLGGGIDSYYITLERESPKGEIVQLFIKYSGAPKVWTGDKVALEVQEQSWDGTDCMGIEQGVRLVSVQRLEN